MIKTTIFKYNIHYRDLKIKKEKLSLKKKSEISEEIVDRIVTQFN